MGDGGFKAEDGGSEAEDGGIGPISMLSLDSAGDCDAAGPCGSLCGGSVLKHTSAKDLAGDRGTS